MKSLLQKREMESLIHRISILDDQLKPIWGKMTVHHMVIHLAEPFRVVLGEKMIPFRPGAFGKYPMNVFVSQLMRWPRGAPTAPEFIPEPGKIFASEFEHDKQLLILLMHRFVKQENHSLPLHPAFGKLSYKQWARLMWRHVDHHLRQFGL